MLSRVFRNVLACFVICHWALLASLFICSRLFFMSSWFFFGVILFFLIHSGSGRVFPSKSVSSAIDVVCRIKVVSLNRVPQKVYDLRLYCCCCCCVENMRFKKFKPKFTSAPIPRLVGYNGTESGKYILQILPSTTYIHTRQFR